MKFHDDYGSVTFYNLKQTLQVWLTHGSTQTHGRTIKPKCTFNTDFQAVKPIFFIISNALLHDEY